MTLKTPLPEKIDGFNIFTGNPIANEAINNIITYLAELTAVVEGKMDKIENGCIHIVPKEIGSINAVNVKPYGTTSSLKKTLLEEIRNKKIPACHYSSFLVDKANGYNEALSDVEAVINRVFK